MILDSYNEQEVKLIQDIEVLFRGNKVTPTKRTYFIGRISKIGCINTRRELETYLKKYND